MVQANFEYQLFMRPTVGHRSAAVFPDSAGTSDGERDRRLPGVLVVPSVVEVTDGGWLWWSEPFRERRTGPGLFAAFVELATAPDIHIRDYARRWGVLRICRHGLPASHNPPKPHNTAPHGVSATSVLNSVAARFGALSTHSEFLKHAGAALADWQSQYAPTECRPLGLDRTKNELVPKAALAWEPIESWRLFAGQAVSVLQIAHRLRGGKVGLPADWQRVYGLSGQQAPWWDQHVDVERLILARVINEWLALGGVRPSLSWSRPDPDVQLFGANLFSAIALQLAFAVSGRDGIAVCSACGRPYLPTRRPKAGQRRYCKPCRMDGAPGRDAQNDCYRRNKSTKKTKG